MRRESGFSLVELSIVLVILGLLTGGVIVGRDLIESAQMRAQINQIRDIEVAMNGFKDKYGAIPGDFTEAERFWPGETSNGDGDGIITSATVGNGSTLTPDNARYDGERPAFFRQLSLAELVDSNYDGTAVHGQGYPEMEAGDSGGMMVTGRWDTPSSGNTAISNFDTIATSNVYLAMVICDPASFPGSSGHNDGCGVLSAQQAWNIDRKLDDGQPHTGKVLAQSFNIPCTTASEDGYELIDENARCNLLKELIP